MLSYGADSTSISPGLKMLQGRTQGGAGLDYYQWQLSYQLGVKTQGGACAASCKAGA